MYMSCKCIYMLFLFLWQCSQHSLLQTITAANGLQEKSHCIFWKKHTQTYLPQITECLTNMKSVDKLLKKEVKDYNQMPKTKRPETKQHLDSHDLAHLLNREGKKVCGKIQVDGLKRKDYCYSLLKFQMGIFTLTKYFLMSNSNLDPG